MKLTFKPLGDEACGAACNVHVLAHQVAIDSCNEVAQVQVKIFHRAIEFRSEVIAQPLGVELLFNVALSGDKGAAGFAHLRAVDR